MIAPEDESGLVEVVTPHTRNVAGDATALCAADVRVAAVDVLVHGSECCGNTLGQGLVRY